MPDFKITAPYQQALEKFIAAISMAGVEVPSTSLDAAKLKPPFTAADVAALAADGTNADFQRYTGYSQRGLLTKWVDPANRTTTCNEFVGRCAGAMGYKSEDKNDGVGRFDIADYLTRNGKGFCWVPASSGATPEYGDPFRLYEATADHNGMSLNHMGISLMVDGSEWYTVEAGQAGPSKGYDFIARKTRVWKPSSLQGWVSMSALLGAGQRAPYWLGGWWSVEEGSYETWYYYFATHNQVYCSSDEPKSLTAPPINAKLVGSYRMSKMFEVEIKWNSADVDETLSLGRNNPAKRDFTMVGVTSRKVPLAAERLMVQGTL